VRFTDGSSYHEQLEVLLGPRARTRTVRYTLDLKRLAYLYTLVSVILGPAILIYGENIYPHKLACFDEEPSIHPLFENTIHQYKVTQAYETIPSVLLILIGVILLIFLVKTSKQHKGYGLAIGLVICMLVGYGLIIGLAALMTACVS
jgi:hypothetical protein